MTTTTVPARTVTTCDGCGIECTNKNRSRSGTMTLRADQLDHQGTPIANGGGIYDFCDHCVSLVMAAVLEVIAGKCREHRT
jgi:hypothetical protein